MKPKIVQQPVYETQRVQTGTVDKTIYVADDGTEFDNEYRCKDYEVKLSCIANSEKDFKQFSLSEYENDDDTIAELLTYSSGVSKAVFFLWTATKDETKLEEATAFIRAKGYNAYPKTFVKPEINEGDNALVVCFLVDEWSDSPDNVVRIIKYNTAIEMVEVILSKMKSIIED